MTSFPRNLRCRPPSNRCIPPNNARAFRLALGNACGKKAPTVALLIGLSYGRSGALPERPQAVLPEAPPIGHWFVAGWRRLSLPGSFPEAGSLLGVGGGGAGLGPD